MNNTAEELTDLDIKLKNIFRNKVVRKKYISIIPEFKKLPLYVSEFLVKKYSDSRSGELPDAAIKEINDFISKNCPEKRDKESYKSALLEMGVITLLDLYQVRTDLRKGKYFTDIKFLDENATVDEVLISPDQNPDLLKSGLYGLAELHYVKAGEFSTLNMAEFTPYQTKGIIFNTFLKNRKKFTKDEWIDILLKTLGFNPKKISNKKLKMLYLARLIPIVEPYANVLEFGPPGTGKSYIYENISEYARVILAGSISAPKLIYDHRYKRNGLIFYKDLICFDEIHKGTSDLKKIIPHFQQIMSSNRVERGNMEAETDISFVFQGNIKFNEVNGKTLPLNDEYLKALPPKMYNPEFMDRIHMFLHGWEFPRVSDEQLNKGFGFLSNYFGNILHELRKKSTTPQIRGTIEYIVKDKYGVEKSISLRDLNALNTIVSGFYKLIYPHFPKLSEEQWDEIVCLAVNLRQNIIDEIVKIDPTHTRTLEYFIVKEKTLNFEAPLISLEDGSEKLTIDDNNDGVIELDEVKIEIVEDLSLQDDNVQTLIVDIGEKQGDQEDIIFSCPYFTPSVLKINQEKFLTDTIPYWLLLFLAEKEAITIQDSNFNILIPKSKFLNHQKNSFPALEIQTGLYSRELNYKFEEEQLEKISKRLNMIRYKIKEYDSKMNNINSWIENLKIMGDFSDSKTLMNNLVNAKDEILTYLSLDTLKQVRTNLEGEIQLIKLSNPYQPDILNESFTQLILPGDSIVESLESNLKKWANLLQKFTISQTYIKEASELKNKFKESKADVINDGKKFRFFSFDLPNLLNSHKHYINLRNPGARLPFRWEKLTNYFDDGPFYGLMFATKNFENEKLKLKKYNDYLEWHIESLYKNGRDGKYVDVDANLTALTYNFIHKYKDQIKEFYFVSGDKDLHTVIDKAKEHGIPVTVVVAERDNLSNVLRDMADNVTVLYS